MLVNTPDHDKPAPWPLLCFLSLLQPLVLVSRTTLSPCKAQFFLSSACLLAFSREDPARTVKPMIESMASIGLERGSS